MLTDAIKEMKEALAAEEGVEEQEENIEEEKEKEEEKPAEEEKEPEAEEEKKDEPKEEEKPDNAAMARMRREAAASKKRAEELEAQLEAERSKKAEETEEEQPTVLPELEEIVLSHRQNKAEQEFGRLEAKFAASNPEYEAVSSQYTQALMQSIKIQNPRLSNQEIAEQTTHTILKKAAYYINKGFDPIEEMFHEAKELGFTGKSAKKEETKEEAEEEIRPDMKKLAANRKKSTGMGGANGRSEHGMTRAYIEQNGLPSPDEWKRLSKPEKQALLYPA